MQPQRLLRDNAVVGDDSFAFDEPVDVHEEAFEVVVREQLTDLGLGAGDLVVGEDDVGALGLGGSLVDAQHHALKRLEVFECGDELTETLD